MTDRLCRWGILGTATISHKNWKAIWNTGNGIASQFSFCADDAWLQTNIRTASELDPAGCLGDLGRYILRMSLAVMDWQMPRRVAARTLRAVRREGSSIKTITDQPNSHFDNE